MYTNQFDKKDIETCLKVAPQNSMATAWIQHSLDKAGVIRPVKLCAQYFLSDDKRIDYIEVQCEIEGDLVKAQVVSVSDRFTKPRQITVADGPGFSPRTHFKSVKKAVSCAIQNPLV